MWKILNFSSMCIQPDGISNARNSLIFLRCSCYGLSLSSSSSALLNYVGLNNLKLSSEMYWSLCRLSDVRYASSTASMLSVELAIQSIFIWGWRQAGSRATESRLITQNDAQHETSTKSARTKSGLSGTVRKWSKYRLGVGGSYFKSSKCVR